MQTKNKILVIAAALALSAVAILWAKETAGTETVPTAPEPKNPCVKVSDAKDGNPAEWDCTENPVIALKWAAYERGRMETEIAVLKDELAKAKGTPMKARITKYSRADSCHNPKVVDGKTWCLTAIGKDTKEGVTVACPTEIAFGTRVVILGHEYVCEDRTAEWVQKKFGTTFDVFLEAGHLESFPGETFTTVLVKR